MKRSSRELTLGRLVQAARSDAPRHGELAAMAAVLTMAAKATATTAALPALGQVASSAVSQVTAITTGAGASAQGALTAAATGKALGVTAVVTKVGLPLVVAATGGYLAATQGAPMRAPELPLLPRTVVEQPVKRAVAPRAAPRTAPRVIPVEALALEEVPQPGAPDGGLASPPPASRRQAGEEAELIDRSHAALRTNPAVALNLVQLYRERFPNGLARPEADAIEIEALSALGRRDEASRSLSTLESADPRSAHVKRLRAILGAPNSSGSRSFNAGDKPEPR